MSEPDQVANQQQPHQRALSWLQKQGVNVERLIPLSGYTNHVFLVEQFAPAYPKKSVLRLADFSLAEGLCPLAHQFDAVLQRHIDVAELGLAPEVIAADRDAGAMWLAYAGEQKLLEQGDCAELRGMLAELHQSGFDWGIGGQINLEALLENVVESGIPSTSSKRCLEGKTFESKESTLQIEQHITVESVQILLWEARQRGYFEHPLVPIHGDLNPGNLLHDGQRWWLIDWDFSGMQLREWDLAGLIVEHGWGMEQALLFAPETARTDIKWFCSCFALLSWHWHVQRGSGASVIADKAEAMQYWITLKG